MIFFGVLRTEQTFLSLEEAIGGVLIAAYVQDRWGNESSFGDVATGGCDGLVVTRFQVMGGHMGQDTLAGQTTAADALARLGHGRTPLG